LGANQDLLNNINNMLIVDPSLFRILGIEPDSVKADGITMSELTYIFAQLNASLAYHFTLGKRSVEFTEARKHFLQNEKVRLAWRKYLRTAFVGSAWADAVDAYISELEEKPI
jgi:hypothetical protein